jgi:hypothetical protein
MLPGTTGPAGWGSMQLRPQTQRHSMRTVEGLGVLPVLFLHIKGALQKKPEPHESITYFCFE